MRGTWQRLVRFLAAARSSPAWRTLRRLAARGAALAGSLALLVVLLVACAGWYTSRPEFCNSCHIMEPYYKSWQASTHKDVSCIECHFPPGLGGKLRGKMLGLVQLAKYVTQSAGTRPTAEIPDASCLRSGCHETRLLVGRVDFHGVPFDHTPHLKETRRGKQLRCTSCHSQIVQGSHMTVTTSTCFLCHFKDEPLNEGLGACTHCHQIPDTKFDLGGGVTFTHDLAYEKGVDCANCHGDVIRGDGQVAPERCLSCHNRPGDLERIHDPLFMHAKHVTEHKIDCLHCHNPIEHSLDRRKLEHAAANCQSCHPNHHGEQVQMLRGSGGRTIAAQSGGMAVVRLECRTCHLQKEVSSTGTVLVRGSPAVCSMCHDAAAVKQFQVYHAQLRASLPELASALARIRAAVPAAHLAAGRAAALRTELENVEHDLDFLRTGNDVHNMHYATTLNHAVADRISALCRELGLAEPKVDLPPLPAERTSAQKPSQAIGITP
ncbi:MAG: cytochrome c3 family protein [Thermoguttaceae bacterium]